MVLRSGTSYRIYLRIPATKEKSANSLGIDASYTVLTSEESHKHAIWVTALSFGPLHCTQEAAHLLGACSDGHVREHVRRGCRQHCCDILLQGRTHHFCMLVALALIYLQDSCDKETLAVCGFPAC